MILRELISKILTLFSLFLFLSFSRGTLRAAVRFRGSTSSPPSFLLRIHLAAASSAGDSSRVPDPDLRITGIRSFRKPSPRTSAHIKGSIRLPPIRDAVQIDNTIRSCPVTRFVSRRSSFRGYRDTVVISRGLVTTEKRALRRRRRDPPRFLGP